MILKKLGIQMDRDTGDSLRKSAEETFQIFLDMGVNTKDPQPEKNVTVAVDKAMKKLGFKRT